MTDAGAAPGLGNAGKKERATQNRLIKLFKGQLKYAFVGNWEEREGNSNVEEELLINWLKQEAHDDKIIGKVLYELGKAKALGGGKNLYDANREVYRLLRYGVKVKPEAGEQNVTVWLIDWKNPLNNNFAIAEEVTIAGVHDKRPDLVLYINGIAVGIIELKRSIVAVSEGIRQNLDNQKKDFIRPFFSTIQLLIAGNETEGLRYGVIETPEKYWLTWKEESEAANPLDRAVLQLCNKERLLELIHDFVVFDAGIKKTCRHNQYFGVRAAQAAVRKREGGIIWHTQGSGKSLMMVWLAKWVREHVKNARVLLITDRTELDEQIEKVFIGVDEKIRRTKSGKDLVDVLNKNEEWLVCSLIHKFGSSDDVDIKTFIKDIQQHLPKNFQAKGDIFVFVDECHRTHSGDLHDAMKAILPGAMFIGFTGTPLLKKDKKKSLEVFGPYIHTYKYDEAVRDGVVLDLRYEARDIDQYIKSPGKIDEWFESQTSGLTDVAKAQLKRRWGTMRQVESSEPRLSIIVADILLDMSRRDRLKSGRGNALLVSSSIYNACRFYEMFSQKGLAGKCAIVTSYKPSPGDIKGEETGEGKTEKLRQYDIYRKMLADYFEESEESAMYKVDEFEKQAKHRFIHEPGQMKLLIVVDKLLTGFDAPPATYLYIDKKMQDHGLFQAICRVNRLDSEDKEYGYIIDYKDLFKSLEMSIQEYTGEAFEAYDAEDVKGLLTDRLTKAKERLDELREEVKALCEPVETPKETINYVHYFCGKSDDAGELDDNEQKRIALYKTVAALLRAYADLANEMTAAGYAEKEAEQVKEEVQYYEKVREEVKLASGDYIDMKVYEPAMRHLLDTYIKADESKTLSAFEDLTLVQLIVDQGEDAVKNLPQGLQRDPEAMAEAIENNVRKLIIDESPVNPKYYEKMSELLDALIKERKQQALHYTAYLQKVAELAKKVLKPETATKYPPAMNSGALRALYDNLGDETLAVRVDEAVRENKRADWRGNLAKERELRKAIKTALGADGDALDKVFELVKAQREY
jgi:type I restriction enzyme R subunit